MSPRRARRPHSPPDLLRNWTAPRHVCLERSGAVGRRRRRLGELLERLLVPGVIGERRQVISDGHPTRLTRIAPAGRRVAIPDQGAAHSLEPVDPDLHVTDAAVGVEVHRRAFTRRRSSRIGPGRRTPFIGLPNPLPASVSFEASRIDVPGTFALEVATWKVSLGSESNQRSSTV